MTRTWACILVGALIATACGTPPEVGEPTETLTAVRITPAPEASPTTVTTPSPSPSPTQTQAPPTPTPSPPAPSPTAPPPEPTPAIVTAEDSGEMFRLSVGDSLTVRLGEEGMVWSDLSHTGDAVAVHERLFLIDPGYREWEVEGVQPGESVLTATGAPPCRNETPPCAAPSRLFEVTILVES